MLDWANNQCIFVVDNVRTISKYRKKRTWSLVHIPTGRTNLRRLQLAFGFTGNWTSGGID